MLRHAVGVVVVVGVVASVGVGVGVASAVGVRINTAGFKPRKSKEY